MHALLPAKSLRPDVRGVTTTAVDPSLPPRPIDPRPVWASTTPSTTSTLVPPVTRCGAIREEARQAPQLMPLEMAATAELRTIDARRTSARRVRVVRQATLARATAPLAGHARGVAQVGTPQVATGRTACVRPQKPVVLTVRPLKTTNRYMRLVRLKPRATAPAKPPSHLQPPPEAVLEARRA